MSMDKKAKKRKFAYKKKYILIIITLFILMLNLPYLINLYITDLANHYNNKANYITAINIQTKLYNLDKKFLGNNEYTIIALENLAKSELLYGNLDNAYKLYLESYYLRKNYKNIYLKIINPFILSDFKYKNFETINSLAYLNFLISDFDNTEYYLNEALIYSRDTFGISSCQNLYQISNLLNFNAYINDKGGVDKYYKLLITSLNNQECDEFVELTTLAKYFMYINNSNRAEKLYNKALKIKNIDECGYKILNYDELALYYQKYDNAFKRNEYLKKGLNAKIEKYGNRHNITAEGYLFFGYLLYKNGELELAKNKLNENLKIQEQLLSHKHPVILCSKYYLSIMNKDYQKNKYTLNIFSSLFNKNKNISINEFCNNYILGGK